MRFHNRPMYRARMKSDGPAVSTDQRVAENIRLARLEAGMSQRELAARMRELGFGSFVQATMTRIEGRQRAVTIGEAEALADAVGTTLGNLIRPPAVARDAALLTGAVRQVLDSSRSLRDAVRRRDSALAMLEQRLKDAEAGEHAEQLGAEIASARHVLRQEKV